MIYWILPDENGDHLDTHQRVVKLHHAEEVFFANGFTDYLEADTDKEARERLGLIEYVPADETVDLNKVFFDKLQVKTIALTVPVPNTDVNAWQWIKSAMTEEQYENMVLAPYFSFGNPEFAAVCAAIKQAGVDIDTLLRGCIIH